MSYWASNARGFDGPRLLVVAVQKACHALRPKYMSEIESFVHSLPQSSIVELIFSGYDDFLVSKANLRAFFTQLESVQWRLAICSTADTQFTRFDLRLLLRYWDCRPSDTLANVVELATNITTAETGRKGLPTAFTSFTRVSDRLRNSIVRVGYRSRF